MSELLEMQTALFYLRPELETQRLGLSNLCFCQLPK